LIEEDHVSSDEFDGGSDASGPEAATSLEHRANGYVTEDEKLNDLLGLRSGATVDDIIRVSLLNPVKYVTSNHGKRIRGKLVILSYRLLAEGGTPSHAEAVQCGICAEVVELIHAGSLVVDDIEDGSMIRRGKLALHIRYGLPTALNAGNWLYFRPFQLTKALELPNRTALSSMRTIIELF
jgi:geranylgeranyl pyrophosphate synthase